MPIANRIRYINKHFTNRLTGLIAGKSHSPIALIKHVGRLSGKIYQTPIMVERSPEGFVFALTYGPNVDWYKNVLAAGKCELLWHGQCFSLEHPQQLDQENGLAAFPNPKRVILKKLRIQDFFEMDVSEIRLF
jgi:deazaflavin-dependent oxidoreductase (nitroreductase family)